MIDMIELGSSIGFSEDVTDSICRYLDGEGLLEFVAFDGTISITHSGIIEIENALSKPKVATKYFPAFNSIHIHGNVINSQIQQASTDSLQSQQITTSNIEELKKLLSDIRNSIKQLELPSEKTNDLIVEIQTIEAQLQSSQPKKSIIGIALMSAKSILESAAGSVIAYKLVEQITSILAVFSQS